MVLVVLRGHASRRKDEGAGEVGEVREVVVVVPHGCTSCWEKEGGKGVVVVKEKEVVVVVLCSCASCCKKEGEGEGGEVLLLLLLCCTGCCEEGEVEVEVEVEVVLLVPVPVLCHCASHCKKEGEVVGMGVPLQEGGLGGGGVPLLLWPPSLPHCHASC